MLIARTLEPLPTDCRKIELACGVYTYLDLDDFLKYRKFKWTIHRHWGHAYACTTFKRDGKIVHLRLHRLCARTPNGQICHHKNGNSLDNRKINLQNMFKQEHDMHHRGGIF